LEKASFANAVKTISAPFSSMKGLPSWFVPLWCIVMPITSFMLMPSVPGTIPAYMLAFSSAFFVALSRDTGQPITQRARYFTVALLVAGTWLLLFCGSQLAHLLSNRHDFGGMSLINPGDVRVVFRSSLFTQTLYLAACVCIALFFRFFFRAEWMRYVLWGGWCLAIYGIYEWLFYLIFKEPGDFIVNRTYGEELHTGSWSQAIQVGSVSLLRIKSTFGEPSWFSAGVIPYLFLALEHERTWLSAVLFFCLVFSTSSSAFVAFPFALILYILIQRKLSIATAVIMLLFAGVFATLYFAFPETYDEMFTYKMNGENDSGQIRQEAAEAMNDTAQTFNLMNHLFGIGFGYSYGGVFFALLVNTGWIGVMAYFYAFLKPVIFLRPDHGAVALKVAVATLFFLFYINVSEFYLPTTWMFLGLAYWQLDQQRYESTPAQFGMRSSPVDRYLLRGGKRWSRLLPN
jgi:hypothetical protein